MTKSHVPSMVVFLIGSAYYSVHITCWAYGYKYSYIQEFYSYSGHVKPLYTSKEKHSLTRKLVGYRNWRQRWCKKEGNKVLRKG